MFRYVLRVETRDEKDHYSPNAASHHSFLRLYAFTTQFVFLLREVSTNSLLEASFRGEREFPFPVIPKNRGL